MYAHGSIDWKGNPDAVLIAGGKSKSFTNNGGSAYGDYSAGGHASASTSSSCGCGGPGGPPTIYSFEGPGGPGGDHKGNNASVSASGGASGSSSVN